jgi:hypothetical protein
MAGEQGETKELSTWEEVVGFPCPSEAILEHVPCPMLDGTLERSGQRLGIELSQCARQLCLIKFSTYESGQTVARLRNRGVEKTSVPISAKCPASLPGAYFTIVIGGRVLGRKNL